MNNYRATFLTLVVVPIVLCAGQSRSHAYNGPGDRALITDITPLCLYYDTIAANATVTYETLNLTAGSDTVIHVQSSGPDGAHIAANDDCGSLRSCITVPTSSSSRNVLVITRAYGDYSAGSATLRVTRNGVVTDVGTCQAGGKTLWLPQVFNSPGQIYTTERANGARDVVVMALSSTSRAETYDDDDGFDYMSWLSVPTAVSRVIVGTYHYVGATASAVGGTYLVWDQEVAYNDPDQDGLGSGLETALGSSPTSSDSDADGLPDGHELKGVEPNLNYPKWGAHPNQLDIFVEVDWLECLTAGCSGPNAYQMSGDEAELAAKAFLGTSDLRADWRIQAHFDIGVPNGNLEGTPSLTQWGSWGGANRRAFTADPCSQDSRGAGRQRFLLAVSTPSSGTGVLGSYCSTVSTSGRTTAHEIGHSYRLEHHGSTMLTGPINNKAVYASIMNYTYQWVNDAQFSSGTFAPFVFSPQSVNETTWRALAPNANPAIPAAAGYKRDGDRIDWNQDGAFVDGMAARPVQSGSVGRFRDNGWPSGIGATARNPALAWWTGGLRVFYMDSIGDIFSKTISNLSSCETAIPPQNLPSTCASIGGAETIGERAEDSIAAVTYSLGLLSNRLMLLWIAGSPFVPNDGIIRFKIHDGSSWSAAQTVPDSANLAGGISAVLNPQNNRIEVFATTSQGTSPAYHVRRWQYDIGSGTWPIRNNIEAVDGSTFNYMFSVRGGPAVTSGYFRNNPTPFLFAAVPQPNAAMLFTSFNPVTGRWVQLDRPNGTITDEKPGFAYVALNPSGAVHDGRFVILARGVGQGFGQSPVMTWTEGNDNTAGVSDHRLVWKPWALYYFQEDASAGSSALLADSGHGRLRGAFGSNNTVFFQPFADGLVNTTFRDENDFDHLRKNLRCPFGGPCPTCPQFNTDGTCAW